MGEIWRKLIVENGKFDRKPVATTHRFKRLNPARHKREEKTTFTTSHHLYKLCMQITLLKGQ